MTWKSCSSAPAPRSYAARISAPPRTRGQSVLLLARLRSTPTTSAATRTEPQQHHQPSQSRRRTSLEDASLRESYDLSRQVGRRAAGTSSASGTDAARKSSPEGPPPSPALSQESALLYRAEDKYQQGVAALQQNNMVLATRLLGEAALLVPKQARYRALYGRALSREKRSRRQAESELLAAVGLDEKNPAYRVMLAELYIEIGLRRRAEGELERALAFDPSHAAARRLLRELRAAK